MAKIFLSYARADAGKAAAMAHALERNGHEVWWDRHLGGGAQFAVEIAAELKSAEAVIVLWSRNSEQSTWVQDEAAEGRDSGRLIPIALDNGKPPLGFRQFQSIDLSRWSGRGRVPKLSEIEAAIATVLKGGTLAHPQEPAKRRRALFGGWPAKLAAALAIIGFILGIYALGSGRFSAAPPTTLAVMPFADFSASKDKAYLAEGVAEEIRSLLSDVDGVRVTGRTSTEMLGPTADFRLARARLGATHLLEGSLRVEGSKMRMHVRLVRTRDGIQLWADEFDRDLKDIFAVQDEIGATVARRLRGTLLGSPLDRRSTRTAVQAFELVLAAIAKWNQREPALPMYDRAVEGEKLLRRAISIDPSYAPAWVALSRNMYLYMNQRPEGAWGPKWLEDRERMLRYARRAVALAPEDADAQAWLGFAEGTFENPGIALARIERAIELNPGDRRVWGLAGKVFGQMCEHGKSLEAFQRVVEVEPLDQENYLDLMNELYAFGRTGEADALRRKISREPELAADIAIDSAVQRGDHSAALAKLFKAHGRGSLENLRAAQLMHAIGPIDRAVAMLPSDYRKSVGAFWQHDYRRAAAEAGWLRYGYWNSARGFALSRSLVHSGQGYELLRLFDGRFGSVEDFDRRMHCDLPRLSAPLVVAFNAAGRRADADKLARFSDQRFRQGLAARHYDEDIHVGNVELLLVTARSDLALGALEQLLKRRGLRGEPPPVHRLDLGDPVYDAIRNHPRFKAVEQRVSAWRAKELRELKAAGFRV